jgi:hypothetical protein
MAAGTPTPSTRISRYTGSVIIGQEVREFDEFRRLRIGDANHRNLHAADVDDMDVFHAGEVVVPPLQVGGDVLEIGRGMWRRGLGHEFTNRD